MKFINFVKETSERSDDDNWAKKLLISQSGFNFSSLEGCNQNRNNQITHLLERAKIEINTGEQNLKSIREEIVKLETEKELQRKANFAKLFGIKLSYILYSTEPEYVFLFEFDEVLNLSYISKFQNYQSFSNWIKSIKGWISTSAFLHKDELPFFDKQLRKNGTAWPTNIDCFISNSSNNQPVAILEFQNAHKTPLTKHCNNNYFWGLTAKDDQRRWLSQEILRVRGQLPFFIITWSKLSTGYAFKELEKIVFPHFQDLKLKALLREFVHARVNKTGKRSPRTIYQDICENCNSEELILDNNQVKIKVNNAPLSYENKTFPMLYYKQKFIETSDNNTLIGKIGN